MYLPNFKLEVLLRNFIKNVYQDRKNLDAYAKELFEKHMENTKKVAFDLPKA